MTLASSRTLPRPGRRDERVQHALRNRIDALAHLRRVLHDEVADQRGDVFRPLAQRRHADRENVEPVEQVGAEPTLVDRAVQVLVRRREHADIHGDRPGAADPLDLALLQHAQQLDLEVGRRDRRSRRGRWCRRRPARTGRSSARWRPVKAPFSWPNSSLSTRPGEIAPQLTGTSGRSARRLSCGWRARSAPSPCRSRR